MTTKNISTATPLAETAQPQLVLVLDITNTQAHWQLDDQTREIGRKGLAKARAALQAARPALLDVAA